MPKKAKDDNKKTDQDSSSTDTVSPPSYNTAVGGLVDTQEGAQSGKRPVNIHVTARQGESAEQMLRRFNFAVTKSDLIQKLRDLQFYEKPSKKRQREEKLRGTQRRNYDE